MISNNYAMVSLWFKRGQSETSNSLLNGAENELQPPCPDYNFGFPLKLTFLLSVNYQYLFWCSIYGAEWIVSVNSFSNVLFIHC